MKNLIATLSYEEARSLYVELQRVLGPWELKEWHDGQNRWVRWTASGEPSAQVYRQRHRWVGYISLYVPRTPTEKDGREWESYRVEVDSAEEGRTLVDENLKRTEYTVPDLNHPEEIPLTPSRMDLLRVGGD